MSQCSRAGGSGKVEKTLIEKKMCLCFSRFFSLSFPKTNVFGRATEKEWGRHVYVLMDGHVLFLKYPNKLFEPKLFVNFTFFSFV